MRFLLTFFALILINQNLCAQLLPGGAEEDYEFGDKETKTNANYYMGFQAKGANMIDDWGIEIGAKFGSYLSKNFRLGGSMYYLISQNVSLESNGLYKKAHLRLTYFGIDAEYVIKMFGALSIGAASQFSLGNLSRTSQSSIDLSDDPSTNWRFIIEPSFNIYYNFSKKTGIGVGLGYRKFLGDDYMNFSGGDLSGTVFAATFMSYIY